MESPVASAPEEVQRWVVVQESRGVSTWIQNLWMSRQKGIMFKVWKVCVEHTTILLRRPGEC